MLFFKLLNVSHISDDNSTSDKEDEKRQEFYYDALFGYIPIMMKKEGENETESQKLYTYDPVYGFVPDDKTGKPDQRKTMSFNPFSSNYNPYGASYNPYTSNYNPFRSSYNPNRLNSNPYVASYIPYNQNNPYYDITISQVKKNFLLQ